MTADRWPPCASGIATGRSAVRGLVLATVLGALWAGAPPLLAQSAAPAAPAPFETTRIITVWASVLFDETGACRSLRFSDKSDPPDELLQRLRAPLERMRIPPKLDGGQPATFETGLRIEVNILSDGSSSRFKLDSLTLQPLPVSTVAPDYPAVMVDGGTGRFEVDATCVVSESGRCTAVTLKPKGVVPETFLRAMRATYAQWTFEPQKLNGRPVPGEATMGFALVVN